MLRPIIKTSNAEAGSMLLQNPIKESGDYMLDDGANFGDKIFKATCCNSVLEDNNNDLCLSYYERRPRNDCMLYAPPTIGKYTCMHASLYI